MFFNKKIASIIAATVMSSSVLFAQNVTTTSSGNIVLSHPLGKTLNFNSDSWTNDDVGFASPQLTLTPTAMKCILYGETTFGDAKGSAFDIIRYNGNYSWSSLFYVQPDGKIGIGTSTPEANLHVKGNKVIIEGGTNPVYTPTGVHIANEYKSSLYFNFENRESFILNGSFSEGQGGGIAQHFSLGYEEGAQLKFRPSSNIISVSGDFESTKLTAQNITSHFNISSKTMRINASKLPTNYKLAVGGKIICEGVRVELQENWPDYVFQSSYKLKSLEEVEQHIQENGYLPNIPSQKEVKDNGIELGEMQRLQMEKIEELTLYLIEQNKKIEFLQGQLQSLQVEK